MVSKNQEVTLPNQSVYSLPIHFENFISRKGIAKHSGGTEVIPLFQEMPLASVIVPVIINSLMSPMVLYSILAFLLIAVIWFVVRKY